MAELRRCIGSARFGIEGHDAPIEDFPKQPTQKDGLGRMCKTQWNQYTAGLARDAKARKADASLTPAAVPEEAATAQATVTPAVTEPEAAEATTKRTRRAKAAIADGQEATG